MFRIQQTESGSSEHRTVSPLAQTFINSIRAISAARTEETASLTEERDQARELLRASLDLLAEKDRAYDRLHYSYFDLVAKHRAVMSGATDYEERAKLDEQREMQLVIDRYEARKAQQREAA